MWLWLLVFVLVVFRLHHVFPNPVRLWLRVALYYACVMLACVLAPFVTVATPFHPANTKRVLDLLKRICGWLPVEYEVRGREHLAAYDKGVVIVSNHQSALDMLTMSQLWPERGCTVAKRSLMFAGPFGLATWLCGTVFIDRSNNAAAIQTMKQATERIRNNQMSLQLFPEGTRHRDGAELKAFKKGAFHLAIDAQLPVLPVVVSCYEPFYSVKGQYWNDDGRVVIQVLPAIDSAPYKQDVTGLLDITYERMNSTYVALNKQLLDARQ